MVADIRRKINMTDHVKEQELLNLLNVATEGKYVAKDEFEALSFNNWGGSRDTINRNVEVNRRIRFWWM